MVATKQKPIVNTQMIKRKEYEHIVKEGAKWDKTPKRAREEGKRELQKQPENN